MEAGAASMKGSLPVSHVTSKCDLISAVGAHNGLEARLDRINENATVNVADYYIILHG